jgi:hypothetical protein
LWYVYSIAKWVLLVNRFCHKKTPNFGVIFVVF